MADSTNLVMGSDATEFVNKVNVSMKVELQRTIDEGNLMKLLGMQCNKFALIVKMLFSTSMRNP